MRLFMISFLIFLMVIALIPAALSASTFLVTNGLDSGPGSLRQAIMDANANSGLDEISFNGGYSITLLSSLPAITDPVIIDGYSVTGATRNTNLLEDGNNANLLVKLDGNNTFHGLEIRASNCTIRGLVIKNCSIGIWVRSIGYPGTGGNAIEGNFIGTNSSASAPEGNYIGIAIEDSPQNVIGGVSPESYNIISGNGIGIRIQDMGDPSPKAWGNEIIGNYIGTDRTGTKSPYFPHDMANTSYGIFISYAQSTTIGSSTYSSQGRNIISGNELGILVSQGSARIIGNYIGTDCTGMNEFHNVQDGVRISGDDVWVIQNIIAYNHGNGISVVSGTQNKITENSIHSNSGLGIDLADDGVTGNDDGDSDTGPNNLQNYPVLTYIESNATQTTIKGTINSTSNRQLQIEFFTNTANDREGRDYLSSTTVTTGDNGDGSGDASFSVTVSPKISYDQYITATATDPSGNTSEFSVPLIVPPPVFWVTNNSYNFLGSLNQAIYDANNNPGLDQIFFNIDQGGAHTIHLADPLWRISDPVIIDATTQPGYSGTPIIELDGSSGNIYLDGLVIDCDGCVIKGLAINNCRDIGIFITYESHNNTIRDNYIGVGIDGSTPAGNKEGIRSTGNSNIIQDNIISNNTDGLYIVGINNEIRSNYIGTDQSGLMDMGNFRGIFIWSDNNIIGGYPGFGNIIAFNTYGIEVLSGTGNSILYNSMYSNGVGIDLDDGANNNQNYPELSLASSTSDYTLISGFLNSTPSTEFKLQLFSNLQCHAYGRGEGETYFATIIVKTNHEGYKYINETFHSQIPVGQIITATATDPDGNTSEFSSCIEVEASDGDADDDGIYDLIDSNPLTPSVIFFDTELGNFGCTYGWIVDKGDQIVSVMELPNPEGVRITTDPSGGPNPATIHGCFDPIEIYAGKEAVIDCWSSLTLEAVIGPIDILLGTDKFVSVPTGGIARIKELGNNQSSIKNMVGSESLIITSLDGVVTEIDIGDSLVTSIPEGPPVCEITPDTLLFGPVLVGNSSERTFSIKNTGGHLLSGVVSESCPDFEIVSDAGLFHIPGSDSLLVTVRFTPSFAGQSVCDINIGNIECESIHSVGNGYTNPISLDIKPESCPNPFNIKWLENSDEDNILSKPKKGGILPVALIGSENFNVHDVDVSTLLLEGIAPLRHSYEDVSRPASNNEDCACTTAGPDDHIDLTLKFSQQDIAATLGSLGIGDEVVLTLTGALVDGTPFEVSDCIVVMSKEPGLPLFTESDEVQLALPTPNPFNPTVTIAFWLPTTVATTLSIYNLEGKLVRTLIDRTMNRGVVETTWDGTDSHGSPVASGVYFYRLKAGKKVLTRKMVLLK